MPQLALTNIITISVSQANPGLSNFNTSNLALYTDDAPAPSVETISFSGVAASGAFVLKFNGVATGSIAYNSSAQAIQALIQAVTGQSNVTVSGSIASQTLTLSQPGQYGAIPLAVVSTNTVETSGSALITITPAVTASGWSGGSLGYSAYLTPTQVGLDFGTSSKTFAMADAVFSQQPNILTGGGQLIIFLLNVSVINIALSGVAASGAFVLTYNSNNSASIAYNALPSAIQAIIQAMPGLGQAQVTGTVVGESLNIILNGVYGAGLAFTMTTNTLQTSGSTSITPTFSNTVTGETIGAAVTRTVGIVQSFGVLVNESCGTSQIIPSADVTAAAAIVLPLLKILFMVSNSSTDLTATTGMIPILTAAGYTNTRMLYYGDTTSAGVQNALVYAASYAGLGLSVNFNGSLTCTTMNLKQLNGVSIDPSMTQVIYNLAQAAGADTYDSFQGLIGVSCSGANSFYDQVYNQTWFVGALQVAGVNYLAQTGTKIPQTETGMDGLKGAYRLVCQQAVVNGYFAPGTWVSATTFGVPGQLSLNIAQLGYYIYSTPIALQSQANRASRVSPLVQIAGKQAGAIQSGSVLVAINP